jgi:hypothetical protein
MKWITRERVKVDRVACPWLIKNCIDPQAEFLFVPEDQVMKTAEGFRHLGFKDDHEILKHEFIVFDALYAYCKKQTEKTIR